MVDPIRTITLKHCTVDYTAFGCRTWFKDRTFVDATPHDTHHYHVIAHRCGYGDDILSYCREHEAAHCIIAEHLHNQPSEVLWALAHGYQLPGKRAAYEEIAAQTLQRWVRANERPILSGVNWDELREYTLQKLDG